MGSRFALFPQVWAAPGMSACGAPALGPLLPPEPLKACILTLENLIWGLEGYPDILQLLWLPGPLSVLVPSFLSD